MPRIWEKLHSAILIKMQETGRLQRWLFERAMRGCARYADQAPHQLPRLPPETDDAVPPARTAKRRLSHDWWVYSFSQLARADAGTDTTSAATLPAGGGNDEPDTADDERKELVSSHLNV